MGTYVWETDLSKPGSDIRKVAKKAIGLYADEVVENGIGDYEIDGYSIRMHRNPVLYEDIYAFIEPRAKDAKYMINVEVGMPKGHAVRWFVGIYYKFEKGDWVEESELRGLTTYETRR